MCKYTHALVSEASVTVRSEHKQVTLGEEAGFGGYCSVVLQANMFHKFEIFHILF